MTNKSKQLIISALICSINPIIAVPIELRKQSELISQKIEGIFSSLKAAINQEGKERFHNQWIKKKQEDAEISKEYNDEGSEVELLDCEAYKLFAAAKILEEQAQAMLAEDLYDDVSRKYKVAGVVLLGRALETDRANKQRLLEKAGVAFNLAADYAPYAEKLRLYQYAGDAYYDAADYASDEETKTELLEKAGDAFKSAADYASDEETKTQLLGEAGDAYNDAIYWASDEKKTQLLDKVGEVEQAKAEEKARKDALAAEKARADAKTLAAAEKARKDAETLAAAEKAWKNKAIKYLFMIIIVVLIAVYIFAFHPAILSTALAYSKSLALLLLNSF